MNNKKVLGLLVTATLFASPLLSTKGYAAGVEFTDISNSYAKDAINQLAAEGILNGLPSGQFNPTGQISRQDFAIILAKALKLDVEASITKPAFTDVPASHYSYKYVEAAAKAGLINGLGDGTFGGNSQLTRQDMAVLFVRALGVDATGYGDKLSFTDASSIAGYAKDAVGFALEAQLIQGLGNGSFNPQGTAKRQEVALVASSFLKVKEEQKPAPVPTPPAPVPIPEPVPEPSPSVPRLLTPPTVTGSVGIYGPKLSYLTGTGWENKITSIAYKFNDEEQINLELDYLDLDSGEIWFETPAIRTGDKVVITIKARGYKDAIVTVNGPELLQHPLLTSKTHTSNSHPHFTFEDDPAWRVAINSITLTFDGEPAIEDYYEFFSINEGNIELNADYDGLGQAVWTIKAVGYEDAVITVDIIEPEGQNLPVGDSQNLFISETIWNDVDLAIEIFNPTPTPVDLSNVQLMAPNEEISLGDFNTLEPGEVLSIVNGMFFLNDDEIPSKVNRVPFEFASNIEADYAELQLMYEGKLIDSVQYQKNKTMIRKSGILQGSLFYNNEEWEEYSQEDLSHLGSHNLNEASF
ncbi:S-layer homology domain-containing protein [Bacillus infantis]|uniref:S-layer homology domain-containing protein n=1 Tax=Bacillus infantis TaxID=324767 RepID=UPI00215519BC|nr:S-layer homology domain-containing protein [Bacillus infantis]MCR6612930.1 S-layer homology domain-containing protein [Bacillus infantis]